MLGLMNRRIRQHHTCQIKVTTITKTLGHAQGNRSAPVMGQKNNSATNPGSFHDRLEIINAVC
jgi:hypothetical protein